MRHCYHCTNSRTCHMRIELAKQIARFKLLAASPDEVANTSAEDTADGLFVAAALACTEWGEKA